MSLRLQLFMIKGDLKGPAHSKNENLYFLAPAQKNSLRRS